MTGLAVLSDSPASRLGDELKFRRYVDPIVSAMTAPATQTPFTIGVFGAWGSGKSSLLGMVEERLADSHPGGFVCVRFNPWVHRREPNLLIPLLHALRDQLNQDPKHRFVESVKRLGVILANLAIDETLKHLTGNVVNLEKIDQLARRYADARGVVESQTRNLRAMLQAEADRINEQNARLVFFVDDLDRCEPDHIIDLLESVKLFLDLRNVFVVLAIAKEVVDRGVAVKYRPFGFADDFQSVIGDEYLDKMVQLPLYLLPLGADEVGQFMRVLRPAPYAIAQVPLLQQIVVPNPRKIKRVLNLLAVTGAIVEATSGLRDLRADHIARLVVLRIQSPDLYADVVRQPALLRALELAYQRSLKPDLGESEFVSRFGDTGRAVAALFARHYQRQDYLAALFAASTFDSVADDLPAYLTLIGG
ncbi:P-loop NTPase fold protein [Dactylosporangium sp. NPDC000521]|uniref:KAP family P-loop NTPase fold protein n=1 Tax=Dactylosporangium sp. NPDC000521 TaxID=3363975 RepID=UPI0036A55DC9